MIALRERLITGDLRPLYLLWLCVAGDEYFDPSETVEPPVPCGLQEFELKLDGLFRFYDIDPLLVKAASDVPLPSGKSQKQPSTPIVLSPAERLKPWLKSLGSRQAKDHLEQLLVGDTATVKAEILAAVAQDRVDSKQVDWPTVVLNRTFEDLWNRTEVLREGFESAEKKKQAAKAQRDAAKAQKKREKRMVEMIKDPQKWLAESERLADERGIENYQLAAEILADLKKAIGGAKGAAIATKHAAHLTRKHPTLNRLKSSLRKRGVLD